jgi:hypothetical protein
LLCSQQGKRKQQWQKQAGNSHSFFTIAKTVRPGKINN